MHGRQLLELLRTLGLGAYITMMGDEHLSEFVGEPDQKVKFLTGFSGSSGTAVTAARSIFYTDGRYTVQARSEVQGYEVSEESFIKDVPRFLSKNAENKRVGVYMKQISSKTYGTLKKAMEDAELTLVPLDDDLVDQIWTDRSPREYREIMSLESIRIGDYIDEGWISRGRMQGYNPNDNPSGSSYLDKLRRVRQIIDSSEALLITDLNTIAWLFNLRGSDIKYQSTFYSYAYITPTEAYLFAARDINLEEVIVKRYEEFYGFLEDVRNSATVVSGDCNAYIYGRLRKARYTNEVLEMKAKKNRMELLGFKYAGVMDGMALTKLFAWLEEYVDDGVTEAAVAEHLAEIKRSIQGFVTPSFLSIVSFSTNSAIIHHQPGETRITRDGMLMIDSGSHYFYGTTDITRTVYFGDPSDATKKHYTLVLKGWLDARNLRQKRILARDVDALARYSLSEENYEYETATGHGVGHFLGVHEKPPVITTDSRQELQENQVFSIEPGFYKEGLYGIRIEDLVYCKAYEDIHYLETLTFVPLALNLVDEKMLEDTQLEQLNSYSSAVYKKLRPFLENDGNALAYLERNTKEMARNQKTTAKAKAG
jgi:Xaa-Pro aminopeptidase